MIKWNLEDPGNFLVFLKEKRVEQFKHVEANGSGTLRSWP